MVGDCHRLRISVLKSGALRLAILSIWLVHRPYDAQNNRCCDNAMSNFIRVCFPNIGIVKKLIVGFLEKSKKGGD